MRRTWDITRCWVFFQPKCISQKRKYSSSWHCSKDSLKNQTSIEDCTRNTTDTGKGERCGGRLTALLKREILAVLKTLGTLPLTVREPGFTPTHCGTGLLKQNEVSHSPPQSSCKSRPKGMAVGSHVRWPGKRPAFLYKNPQVLLCFYLNQKTLTAPRTGLVFFFSENTRY